MDAETQVYLVSRFRKYYETEGSSKVKPPKDFPKREFAFTYFDKEGMFRHIGLPTLDKLLSHLRVNSPSHAYLSAAHYVDPGAPTMGEKGWKGTDLIFDIDADHLDVPCKKKHDRWVCKDCGKSRRGPRPEKCPYCQSAAIDDQTWLCEECITQAKSETFKLLEILGDDFGFPRSEIDVTYTGHRGYHVKVDDPSIHSLTPSERREIVDYITGRGIDLQAHGLTEQGSRSRKSITGPGEDNVGWGLRIYKSLSRILSSDEAPAEVLADRARVMKDVAAGRYDAVRGIALKRWNDLVMKAIDCYGTAHIDEPVTTDIHRLIRLEGSLHGKTGFAVTRVADLESFDPFKEAVAFKSDEMVKVHIDYCDYSFRIGDQTYGPFEEPDLQLPLPAAVFFMCKGIARKTHGT